MKFKHPPGGPDNKFSLLEWTKFQFRRMTDWSKYTLPSEYIVPLAIAKSEFANLSDVDSITYCGHNTTLIKLDGKIILTDPLLTDYLLPFKFGPKRLSPPGLQLNELPPIDIIIVSHNHFDHLNLETLASIKDKETLTVIVPLAMGHHFKKLGYKHVFELNWYEHKMIDTISVTALPSYHSSRRSLWDHNNELWADFCIASSTKKIFFDGNTAYGSVFKDIGKKFGPFDYALLSVGAYEPNAVLKHNHTTPEEAVKIALDIEAKTIIPIHWGTLILSDEPLLEPPKRFTQAALANGFSEKDIWTFKIGETRKI